MSLLKYILPKENPVLNPVLVDKDACSSLSREDLKLAGEKSMNVWKLIGLPGVNQRSSTFNLG